MNRKEWLEWRHQGIGSSDAPIIMGVSPWKTPLQLFEEKLQETAPDEEPNYVQRKGIEVEPRIRSYIELVQGQPFPAALCVMEKFPFIRASLDGKCDDIIIEIKLSGAADFMVAVYGTVPEKYIPQVQHQLMVSGASNCLYISHCEDESGSINSSNTAIVLVHSDKEYQAKLLEMEVAFWDHVKTRKPPVPSDRDYKPLKGLTPVANKYKRLLQKEAELSAQLEETRGKLIDAAKSAGHPRLTVAGLKIIQMARVGSVDYKKIPQLQGIDLDQYRGKGSLYWTIKTEPKESVE